MKAVFFLIALLISSEVYAGSLVLTGFGGFLSPECKTADNCIPELKSCTELSWQMALVKKDIDAARKMEEPLKNFIERFSFKYDDLERLESECKKEKDKFRGEFKSQSKD